MANWKTFTEEELKDLRANPYVKSSTTHMVRFTVAFKEEFWRRYNEECENPRKIIAELGFDPNVLGKRRIDGILMHIKEQADEGFRDVRIDQSQVSSADKELSPSKSILKMQHKVAYLEQELEFIKKTILADNAARRK